MVGNVLFDIAPVQLRVTNAFGFDQQRLHFGARKTRAFAGRSKHYDGTFLHVFNCASYRALRQRFSPGVVSARGP